MNYVAKHFFDYQSFVNIPHKAVQLHKQPYSEAGVDTTATWGPKNMRVQGKNMPTPASRSNRNRMDFQVGSHRHGQPSKLAYRRFGERHGELKEERIVPHKDKWMIDGGFRHFGEECEEDQHKSWANLDFLPNFFRAFAPISLTIKELRGIDNLKNPFLRIQLYDGRRLVEERRCTLPKARFASYQLLPLIHQENDAPQQNGPTRRFPPTAPASPQLQHNHVNRVQRRTSSDRQLFERLETIAFDGESFLLRLTSKQIHNAFIVIQLHASRRSQSERRHLTTPVDGINQLDLIEELENIEQDTKLIGCSVIGATGTQCRGHLHWQQMVRQVGNPVCMWHKLMGSKRSPV
ncbi:hypothetical protein M3Y97_00592400 [Aphelenchoides bicaudatus]|nr:hypothetical protein M3Y97_00592400 [Aphelenchoides bicaudatus]